MTSFSRTARRLLRHVLLTAAVASVVSSGRADVTGAQVKQAIGKGLARLKALQKPDGNWPERQTPGGETCLATLALLYAGESAASPAVAAALPRIRGLLNQSVYVTSLKIMVLARADPALYQRDIRTATQWLIHAQNKSGLWRYTASATDFDHSNSQFALLGLHAAAEAGANVPAVVWREALAKVLRTQNPDGGWCYQEKGNSYASMTAAGVADLLILGSRLETARENEFRNGIAPNCGKYRASKPLANGLEWLGRNFRADRNFNGPQGHTFYWLYAAERCGMLSGQRLFASHDWYREGARYLVNAQKADGTWGEQLADTCFALLFLAKGHKPLLVQKLQWSADDAWNPDRHDLENLLSFIGDKLGQPVAWQAVQLDAPLEEWLAAPLLYMQGHKFPAWSPQQAAKLRAFVDQGGTVLFEACCGQKEFRDGSKRFAAETFPEFPLRELGEQHSIYHVQYHCKPNGLMGIDLGCRTSVVFSPNDLSCLWEQANVAKLSEQAFQLGTNIAAYATGRRPLVDRLDAVVVPEAKEANPAPPARDALRIGQVVYESDWRPFPQALVRLAEFLRSELNLDVISQYRQVHLTDPELYTCPILYMAGHYDFKLSPQEQTALVTHLRRGGFVLVDNCCGPEPFDATFRALVRQVFPNSTLELLPANHPIFVGQPGFDVRTVHYGPDVRRARPDLTEPQLWGLELDGRLALVYSPFALGCGLEGQEFEGCWGLASDDARRLAANIVLYALTH